MGDVRGAQVGWGCLSVKPRVHWMLTAGLPGLYVLSFPDCNFIRQVKFVVISLPLVQAIAGMKGKRLLPPGG